MTSPALRAASGIGHRLIDLRIVDTQTAQAWLEDDFHHFGVTIEHRNHQVTAVHMQHPRTPWTTCPGAAQPLQALVGKTLIRRSSDIGQLIDMRLQCTHVFDLTGLLLAHIAKASERKPHRRYLTVIPDRPFIGTLPQLSSFGKGSATLLLDDQAVMHWQIEGDRIIGEPPYGGHSQNEGFREWTEAMPEDEAEYATILRRAILVAGGRNLDHDYYPNAAAMGVPAVCHSFQPEQRQQAARIYGSTYNYTKNPQDMLSNVVNIEP